MKIRAPDRVVVRRESDATLPVCGHYRIDRASLDKDANLWFEISLPHRGMTKGVSVFWTKPASSQATVIEGHFNLDLQESMRLSLTPGDYLLFASYGDERSETHRMRIEREGSALLHPENIYAWELRLTLDKEVYRAGESIHATLSAHNHSSAAVVFDLTEPESALDARLHVAMDGFYAQAFCAPHPAIASRGIVTVAPNDVLVLVQGELSSCRAVIYSPDDRRDTPRLGPSLVPARYEVTGSLHVIAEDEERSKWYSTSTEPLPLRIQSAL